MAWAAIAFAVFPLLYVLSVSLNPVGTFTGSNQLFRAFDLGDYERLMTDPDIPTLRDTIDPVRRFERDFPEWAARIAGILDAPVEAAAHGLYRFTREVLEPGWPEFPRGARMPSPRVFAGSPAPDAV